MGNTLPRHMLDPPADWAGYLSDKWRSPRSRELDALGGLGRPPIIRGASFQKKLEYLGSMIGGRADEMQGMFENFDAQIKQIGVGLETKTRLSGGDVASPNLKRALSLSGKTVHVAAWRVRVFAARRRLVLVVWVAVRFRGISKRPSRLRRVDSFSYMIPDFLGPDAAKFVQEQIKYAEAMHADPSDNDADNEAGDGDDAASSERWSPDSGRLSRGAAGGPVPLSATVGSLPAFTLGRGSPRRSSASGTVERPNTSLSGAARRSSFAGAAAAAGGNRGGPQQPNYYKPFQTYRKGPKGIPAQPAPLPKRGTTPGAAPRTIFRSSASGAEPGAGRKPKPPQLQLPLQSPKDLPLSSLGRTPTSRASTGGISLPRTSPLVPSMAFISESLRLPSIAAMGSVVAQGRPLRHKSSLVQHWITGHGNIQRYVNGPERLARASFSGVFPAQPPPTVPGPGMPSLPLAFVPHPPGVDRTFGGGGFGGGRPVLPRTSSPGLPTVSASLPSLDVFSSGLALASEPSQPPSQPPGQLLSQPAAAAAWAPRGAPMMAQGGRPARLGSPGGYSSSPNLRLAPAGLGGSWPVSEPASQGAAAAALREGGGAGAASGAPLPGPGAADVDEGGDDAVGGGRAAMLGSVRHGSKRQITFGDRPRVKWDAQGSGGGPLGPRPSVTFVSTETSAVRAEPDHGTGPQVHAGRGVPLAAAGRAGERRGSEAGVLLPASASEPSVFSNGASSPRPEHGWLQSPSISGPEASPGSHEQEAGAKLDPGPRPPPWGQPAQHGRFSTSGRMVLMASLEQHLAQEREVHERERASLERGGRARQTGQGAADGGVASSPQNPNPGGASHSRVYFSSASGRSRGGPGGGGTDDADEDGESSVASGRSVATSVFSVYNSEYQFGDSEYDEERDEDINDADLLDPAFWRAHTEEHSHSQPNSQHDSPQASVSVQAEPPDAGGVECGGVGDAHAMPAGPARRASIKRPVSGRQSLRRAGSRIQWRDTHAPPTDDGASEPSPGPGASGMGFAGEGEDSYTYAGSRATSHPFAGEGEGGGEGYELASPGSSNDAEDVPPITPVSAAVVLRPGLSRQPPPQTRGPGLRNQATLVRRQNTLLKRQATLLARNMSRRQAAMEQAAEAAEAAVLEEEEEEEEVDVLGVVARCKMMMRMYVNRCNAAWAELQGWSMPSVHSLAEQKAWDGSAQSRQEVYGAQQAVRMGKVAFWFLAGEDHLPAAKADSSSGFTLHDIWSADPYTLISHCRPGLLHGRSLRKGHSYQSRALGQLALAVTAAGGKRALASTYIVLHINDEQQEEVMRDLFAYKYYGFEREHVILVMQPKRPGYRYDPGSRQFVGASGAATHPETTGTGLAAMQLNWCPDSYVLNCDGMLEPLPGTPLEVLHESGVESLLCYRARDMAVLNREGVLDLQFLARSRWLRDAFGTNIATQVLLSDSMTTARALNSVVLTLSANRSNAEMRMGEMASHALSKVLSSAKSEQGGKVTIGLQRYMFNLPSLKSMLSTNKHFRPRLRLHDELLFVSFDIANVTSLPGASLAAVQIPEQPDLLLSRKELSNLLDVVQQQDTDDLLMNLLDSLQPPRFAASSMLSSPTDMAGTDVSMRMHPGASGGSHTVVFVNGTLSNLAAIRMAVALARPGRGDTVHIVTFVADEHRIPQGRALLMKLRERLGTSGSAMLRMDVLIRGTSSLLGAMQAYVVALGADLVVVPSATLGRPNAQDILGSVALAIMKAIDVPVLLVTPRCSQAAEQLLDRKHLRMLLMVEGWSLPLLEFVCERLLVPKRSDKLLLGQAFSSRSTTRQQMDTRRWHLAEFRDFLITRRNAINVDELVLDGDYNEAVLQAVVDSKVNVLGVHLPPGMHTLPKSLVSLLCGSQAAVLVMKRKPHNTVVHA